MSKRGSLSISTNAIVVLIIAVIMLGLIIGLVTRGFSAVEQQFLSNIEENEPEPRQPTTSQPIALSQAVKYGTPGEPVGFKINILNTAGSGDEVTIVPSVECQGDSPLASNNNNVVDVAFEQELGLNEVGYYIYRFDIANSANEGEYLCRMHAKEGDVDTEDTSDNWLSEMTPTQFRLIIQ